MDIKLGSTAINKMYLGATEIKKTYLAGNIWTPPVIGGSYAIFDGASHIDFGNPPELQFTDDITVEAGIRTFTSEGGIVGKIDSYEGFGFILDNSLGLNVYGFINISTPYVIDYTAGQPSLDNSVVECSYVNGVTEFKVDDIVIPRTQGGNGGTSFSNTKNLSLGRHAVSDTNYIYLNADIRFIKVYHLGDLVLDFDPETYGDLEDHSVYAHSSTNNGVTLG